MSDKILNSPPGHDRAVDTFAPTQPALPAAGPASKGSQPTTFPNADVASSAAVWNSVKSSADANSMGAGGVVGGLPQGIVYQDLGKLGDPDVESLAFITLMEASKSAQEDLKQIMDGVKAITHEKNGLRKLEQAINPGPAVQQPPTLNPNDKVIQTLITSENTDPFRHK